MKLSSIKSSCLLSAAFLASATLLSGCYTPQPTTLYGAEDLPKQDWYTLSESSSEVKTLPAALRNALEQQRQEVAAEQSSKGELTAQTKKRISDLNEACNGAFLVSFDNIATNPTPELNGQFETWDRRRQNDSMVFNQNLRALADEWSYVWLMERPGGTPYDTVNTTGRY